MAFLVLEDIQLVRGPFWATMGDNKAYGADDGSPKQKRQVSLKRFLSDDDDGLKFYVDIVLLLQGRGMLQMVQQSIG